MQRPEPHDRRVANLIAAFEQEFGRRPEGVAEAPGRVNLIGEHVDYNDGLVLPFAIDRTVMCVWDALEPPMTIMSALDLGEREVLLEVPGVLEPPLDHAWLAYPEGVLLQLEQRASRRLRGKRLLFTGDVPRGAGLSSSAALEVAVAGALRDAFDLPIDDGTLAKLCQRAENEYVGVQCGIMDQFASALSKKDHGLLIDCRTLAYEHIPLRLEQAGLVVVIVNSAVQRQLASSAYNDRRRECEEAVAILRERLSRPDLTSLRDLTAADLDRFEIDSAPMRRARHVVTEIARVAACVEALRSDDFTAVGQLMIDSHISLRDDYDVSSAQLDLLVAVATAQDYVLGARLTGAGFGGCTVNLVRADAIDAFEHDVVDAYRQRTGLPAETYATSPQDGLRTRRLETMSS